MLTFDYDPPKFPDPSEFGLTREETREVGDWDTVTGKLAEFVEAEREVMIRGVHDAPGIPMHKVGDNSGWLVTPLEIVSALEILKRADTETVDKVRQTWAYEDGSGGNGWDEWLEFLRWSSTHGGFRVH